MRLTTALLIALPACAAAQQQFPLANTLQFWFEKAKSYLPDAATTPITAAKAKAAAANITPLTVDNWQTVLSPSPSHASNNWRGPETWMVFVSGTNKTCFGLCGGLEVAWNETAALFAADPTAPRLGYINCDRTPVLCAIWHAHPPTVWYIQLPVPEEDQSPAPTTVHIVGLNTTTTTTRDIVRIHTEKTYKQGGLFEGAFQPFDGWLAQLGLAKPIAYVLVGVSMVPSWAFMIIISFVSRNLM